ncbi:hypothetical protein O6H91_01G159100 [Diphasiastrum complanatum]|uniref:Uncharacterized protein n=1 Tax=Diphasiastrum complanatum TaxID=34168 RepID=A0ACC2EXZ7_DIPCM|nr:hypothetical protein O6H91_01G159100 [Diphasiastrum complanatum]
MQTFSIGAFVPLTLLSAAFVCWNLISLLFLLAFFLVQYKTQRSVIHGRSRQKVWVLVVLLATAVISLEGLVEIAWAIFGKQWNFSHSSILDLLGFSRLNPWKSNSGVLLSLLPQFLVIVTAACTLYYEQTGGFQVQQQFWDEAVAEFRANLRSFLLPMIQVIVGVVHPSWISFPYFVCSCAGLLHWSLTNNFVGLSWGWRPLLFYNGVHILMLYVRQLPISLSESISKAATYAGLFKMTKDWSWLEIVQAMSLILLYVLLSVAIGDVDDMGYSLVSSGVGELLPLSTSRWSSAPESFSQESSLSESLLRDQSPAYHIETLSSRWWAVEHRRLKAFRSAAISFFTYGFPVCMFALVCWSFKFESFFAFFLLLYVGYVLYAFPSLYILRHLNVALLGFILIWALSTYFFNAAFSVMDYNFKLDMDLWNTIGLWHYSSPGLLILAQFALGVLVATDIFVSNSILDCLNEAESVNGDDQGPIEEDVQNATVLFLAVTAWCIRKSAHVISLVLIFVVARKDGLLHAVYMIFFMIYLVYPSAATRTRKYLILFCELHFALLYLLQLDWISMQLESHAAFCKPILSQLGIWDKAGFEDFAVVSTLLCFCAIQDHGLKVINSLSVTVQQQNATSVDMGFSRVQACNSVLLSVFASQSFGYLQQESRSNVIWITKYLTAIGESFRATYRSFGTHIVFATVLLVLYAAGQNYVSLGYMCFLLFWIIGRQMLGETTRHLWLPLMIFAGLVFLFRYVITVFPDLQMQLSKCFNLRADLGFDPNATLVENLWDPLAILSALQLYRYERSQTAVSAEDGDQLGDHIDPNRGYIGFFKRLLILHSGKFLIISTFYAAITPVSAAGFLYALMIICTSTMSKTCRFPGQLCAFYSGLLIISEYVYQMWGSQAEMFPGQIHGPFMHWLGFRVYSKGFWGTESGARSKVIVLIACMLQYCTFKWLDQLPASLQADERDGEPCLLFLPYPRRDKVRNLFPSDKGCLLQQTLATHEVDKNKQVLLYSEPQSSVRGSEKISRTYCQQLDTSIAQASAEGPKAIDLPATNLSLKKFKLEKSPSDNLWEISRESKKWSKRAMLFLKRERYEAQLRTLKIYFKHTVEHFFKLYGLEINMLGLLIGSFAVLNVISLVYVLLLALYVLVSRRSLKILWPLFVLLFASIMVLEYVALGKIPPSWSIPHTLGESEVHCHECWKNPSKYFDFCSRCWLGIVVDDRQMLVAYFMVYLISCMQLRANLSSDGSENGLFHSAVIPASDRMAWQEISYNTIEQWTWLDHLRFLYYCHLLHVVLLLVFITGTLQYDLLHLGYLAFSMVFFRMRATIMRKRNRIFFFLRLYNFALIIASLVFQAPFFGYLEGQGCTLPNYFVNIFGLYKYDYGFKITARSALVDITIFCLVGLQSHIFRTKEFEQVLRYLEAQQVEARAHAQERKAAWKKKQLQRVRDVEEYKRRRHLQVDKIKTDMVRLQHRLDVLSSAGKFSAAAAPLVELVDCVNKPFQSPSLRPSYSEPHTPIAVDPYTLDSNTVTRGGQSGQNSMLSAEDLEHPYIKSNISSLRRRKRHLDFDYASGYDNPARVNNEVSLTEENNYMPDQITKSAEIMEDVLEDSSDGTNNPLSSERECADNIQEIDHQQKQGLLSGVHLLEDGVAQMHQLGNKALANLADLLNIDQTDSDDTENSSAEDDARGDNKKQEDSPQISSAVKKDEGATSTDQKTAMSETLHRLSVLLLYCWSKLVSHTDIVCYFFFVLVYVWNFSLLTLVFPAVLFLYALTANPGPSQNFWLGMLIYIEINILLQYMYQILVTHCGNGTLSLWLKKLGIPGGDMSHSFVTSVLPLFLVYLATLTQSSIKARDGEWMSVSETSAFPLNRHIAGRDNQAMGNHTQLTWKQRVSNAWVSTKGWFKKIGRRLLRGWKALTHGSETPPHFVQVTMRIGHWPADGIQPERIESAFNRLLTFVHQKETKVHLQDEFPNCVSRVRVESIENSPDDSHIALAVLEVIYAAPPRGHPDGTDYVSLTPAADVASEILQLQHEGKLVEAGIPYPIKTVVAGGKREIDLYAYIFGTDLIAFLYVALFYQSALKNSPEFLYVYQLEDQFPKDFVFVLMTLFFLIVLDRVLYLSSSATIRVLYYYFSLCLYTAYVTNFVWGMELVDQSHAEGYFFQLLPLRGFFLIKALSLSFQALQIKYGMPYKSNLYGQFLTRKITNLNWLGFRIYRALPFLFELRCVLDWSCTTTSLTMYDWLKLEDIYASLFLVQCDIKLSREKHHIGQKQGIWIKFFSGICVFLLLICVIWAPMLMYSSGNPTNIVNQILEVHTQIHVKAGGGSFSLYETRLCELPFMEEVRRSGFDLDPNGILASYDIKDIQLICCQADADILWLIPPPTLQRMINLLDESSIIKSKWDFYRERPKTKETATYLQEISDSTIGPQLQEVLKGTHSTFSIPDMYPRYFRVTGAGEARQLEGTKVEMESGNLTLNQGKQPWWSFVRNNATKQDGCGNMTGPLAIAVSEEVPKGLIGDTLSKFSIWSLYITFVMAVGRFIRLQCADLRMRIPYENLPSCDRLLAICEDIYAARAEGELELEEGLFWTLVKIYRSPHILMEYTKVD